MSQPVRPAALEPRTPRGSYDRPAHRPFRVRFAVVPVEHPGPTQVSRVPERRRETRRHRHIADPSAFGRIDVALPKASVTVIKEGPKTPTAIEPAGDRIWIAERGAGKAMSIPMPR